MIKMKLMKIIKIYSLCLLITLSLFSNFGHAALPIQDCATFEDEDLMLLCFQQSIEEELESRIDRLPLGVIDLNLSPLGYINYVYVFRTDYAYRPYVLNRISVLDELFSEVNLSEDDPETNYFEMQIIVIQPGHVFISKPLKKRSFNIRS